MDDLVFSRRNELPPPPEARTVALDFEARRKRHQSVVLSDGTPAWLRLQRLDQPLSDGDVLGSDDGRMVVVLAAPEQLLHASAAPELLARCAYHLGNRHAAVEILPSALRTPADPVMRAMLEQLGAAVEEIEAPFRPEVGAYHHEHDHAHGPGKIHRFVRL